MNVEARPAGEADLDRLAELWEQAAAELRGFRGGDLYIGREARPAPASADLADGDRLVLAGAIDDAVVGFVAATDGGSGPVTIDSLYVEAEARAVGVGEELMAAVVRWATDRGASGIDAAALPGARDTKNFFEASGFKARLLVMHHTIG